MTRDVLNAIPAGMKSTGQIGVLIPGVTSTSQDVGGTQFSADGLAIHGSRLNEQAALYDGMQFNNGQGRGGQFVAIITNDATVQEMAIETAGLSAEAEASGIRSIWCRATAATHSRASFLGVLHRSQSAGRQPQRRADRTRPDLVGDGEAGRTTSIRRSAVRSSRTSCGSGGRYARRPRSRRSPASTTT